MRIAGGDWRGRNLKVPAGDAVRPTQDRVREALFSMLMGAVEGARVLDLFAGSGGVGFEALSRGAAACTFVEMNPRHLAVIADNMKTFKAEGRVQTVCADVYAWLASSSFAASGPYDIAFADPPYALGAEKGYAGMLATLAVKNVVKPGGIFVVEMKSRQKPDESPLWDLVRDRTYGQTRLAVYVRGAGEQDPCRETGQALPGGTDVMSGSAGPAVRPPVSPRGLLRSGSRVNASDGDIQQFA